MVGAPISYSGYPNAPGSGGIPPYGQPPPQMYATPNASISTLLPYNGFAPPGQAPMSYPQNPASSAPINTTYLYPPNPPSSAAAPPPFPPCSAAPSNLYPPSFPTYQSNPGQNPYTSSAYPPTGYPVQPNTQNFQAPSGYPTGPPTGAYPPPPSQYYPQANATTQPPHSMGIYPPPPAMGGVYQPPRY